MIVLTHVIIYIFVMYMVCSNPEMSDENFHITSQVFRNTFFSLQENNYFRLDVAHEKSITI